MVDVLEMPTPGKRGRVERLVFRGIVFNMSWEDPEMDRRAFQLTSDDTVISITSAGCNPLNFLCAGPKRLISIDGNPAQNAVLELKLAAIRTLDYETFFDIFAARAPQVACAVYRAKLRPHLSEPARQFWDGNLWMLRRNLYNFGRMGLACRLVRMLLPVLGISRARTEQFFELRTLAEQKEWYDLYVAPRLWGPVAERLCKSRLFMYLCGVHPNQYDLVHDRHNIYDFVKERIEYVLTKVPIYDNYFLSVTVTGKFRGDRVPPYLRAENFQTLRDNLDRVQVVYGWLGPFLDTQPESSINRFNLLDIFDWMPPDVLEGTWRSILRAAAPDAIMIFRSGSYQLDLPDAIESQLVSHDGLASELFAIDRSATYGSFYIKSLKDAPDSRPTHLLNGHGSRVAAATAVGVS